MTAQRQPLLHDQSVVFRAPMQAWSAHDGTMGRAAIHGIYFSDVRLVSGLTVTIDGEQPTALSKDPAGSARCLFTSLLRAYDTEPDPRLRVEHRRTINSHGSSEEVTLCSNLGYSREVEVVVTLALGLDQLDSIKSGIDEAKNALNVRVHGDDVEWSGDGIFAALTARDAEITVQGTKVDLRWTVALPAAGSVSVMCEVSARDETATVLGDESPLPWSIPLVENNERLACWVSQSLSDLDGLRMTTVEHPELSFLAAGSPWFFTLFGRDSIWAARFMLPLGTDLAFDTLKLLAEHQGTEIDLRRAEEPGKILHEMRRAPISVSPDVQLPPLYYGTVDATPLWICLLHDAWRWGLDDDSVRSLLTPLREALGWLRDHADADGDGLLEYADNSGQGLANQGWKDSGDSVQWNDGTLATGPIALCEVQAYAYEAAIGGASILEHFGEDGTAWRTWAGQLKDKFRESFWISDDQGPFPAIALDATKRPIDSLTSNIGHLLGTGILDRDEEAIVAARLVAPELNSGFGLRTLATSAAGYWPLSYHGGSVWTHDTAIAISGLTKSGFTDEAAILIDGLLEAAAAFDYRTPELHSGDSAETHSRPAPYPAACRPQAWSAAASVSVYADVAGLKPASGLHLSHQKK
ncbi:glycogen debranching N-terminal domain-containing protein [Rhodoglobus sp.]